LLMGDEDRRLRRIILHRVDDDGMFVGRGVRLNAARRYLQEHPDSQSKAAKRARKLLEE
jgi:hypothetical protein